MNFFNFFKKGDANDSRRINSDIFIAKRDEDILNIRSAFFNVINRQDVLTDTIKILMAMADKQEFIYMWLKDKHDRYIFASKNTRRELFENKHISKIINRTDSEISTGKKLLDCVEININGLTPENLVHIGNYIDKDTVICNLTDVITKQFNKPCKFVECINDLVWIVWKEPLYSHGVYAGNVGYAIDMSTKKDEVFNLVKDRVESGEAFRIDNTNSYYLSSYAFPDLHPRRFI